MNNKLLGLWAGLLLSASVCAQELRGTLDLGAVVERASGSVQIINTTTQTSLGRVEGLGDLSHASMVFSRDGRYAYVFGRDGGLTQVDLLTRSIKKRVMQAGNSIGGAISQDGRLLAVANYEPGGVRLFTSDTLEQVADIPAVSETLGKASKVVGIEDAPGGRFVFSLFDAGEIWLAEVEDAPAGTAGAAKFKVKLTKFTGIGKQPYDALVTPDGRYYIAGLFGENGLAVLDLWNVGAGVKRVLQDYGKEDPALPVYKMPHLETWATAGRLAFLPAVGHHEVLVVDMERWVVQTKIPVQGQPVFVMAQPDGHQLWVNFALPDYEYLQVIDVPSLKVTHTLKPGKAVLHMEFTPRGERMWLSLRDENRVEIYDPYAVRKLAELPAQAPSGIFFAARATRTGL
jgi:protein NirF